MPLAIGRVVQQYEQAFAPLLHHFWKCFPPDRTAVPLGVFSTHTSWLTCRVRHDLYHSLLGTLTDKAQRFGQQLLMYRDGKLHEIMATMDPTFRPLFANLKVC